MYNYQSKKKMISRLVRCSKMYSSPTICNVLYNEAEKNDAVSAHRQRLPKPLLPRGKALVVLLSNILHIDSSYYLKYELCILLSYK